MLNIRLQSQDLQQQHVELLAHTRWLACSYVRVRPIALTHVPSSDQLITRTMLPLHRTTLPFVAQRRHQDVRPMIARSITYLCTTFAKWRFRSYVLSYEHFFSRSFIKQIANFFGRIRSCNNCETPTT